MNARDTALRLLCDGLAGRLDLDQWAGLAEDGWRLLIALANEEGVAPLLRYELEENGWLETLPAEVQSALHRAYFATAANNVIFFSELCRVLDVLGSRDAPEPVVLKGADLALTLYPNVALRPMCDLDLLVSRESVEESVKRLSQLGYHHALTDVATGHRERTAFTTYLAGGPKRSVAVELHWGLVAGSDDRRSPQNLDWFWKQTEPVTVDIESGTQFRHPETFVHLTPTAHLLYLAAHLVLQHGGARLLWHYDIHRLVSQSGHRLDWEEIQKHARELGWTAPLNAALEGARERFHTSLPEGVLASVGKKRGFSQPMGGAKPYDEAAWDELMGLTWPARLRFLWDHFFPRKEYVEWRYQPKPAWLWPLYYPYRWSVFTFGGLKLAAHRTAKALRR
jgi:hypothetical protein